MRFASAISRVEHFKMASFGNAIPPPSKPADANAAFADALKRAKEIAARMGSGPGAAAAAAGSGESAKRPLEAPSGGEPAPKKPLVQGSSDIVIDAKAIAMQVAANIAQRAGLQSMPVEDLKIPNKYVGLIIGKGGEQINKLQSETGARVQVAPDPPAGAMPPPDRAVTISGNPEAVEKARNLILKICEDGKVPDSLMSVPTVAPGESLMEVMIPASKVGLIIGKGGETIKNLQERAQCKMVMVQDGQWLSAPEKPLRITGEQSRCQRGKDLVMDLLTEKELEQIQQKGPDFMGKQTNEYGTPIGGGNFNPNQRNFGGAQNEIPVPKESVGFIIGKQGDTIKRLQAETGARIQFKPDEINSPTRVAMVQGPPEQVQRATQLINEIVEQSRQRSGGSRGGPPIPTGPGIRKVDFPVPAAKCGLVIGKGGETIRQINQVSGAHVELNRNIPENGPTRLFTIRGTDQQVQQAQSMIQEKTGDSGGGGYGQRNHGQNDYHQGGYQQNQNQNQQQGWQGYPYQQQYGQQHQNPYGQNNYGQQQQGGPQGDQNPATSGAPTSGAGPTTNAQGQPDYSAAWAMYYQQLYQQQAAAAGQPGANTAQGGQPDYTAQWMEYYRQQGYYYPYGQPGQQQPGQQQPGQQQQQQQGQQPPGQQPPQGQQPGPPQQGAPQSQQR